MDRPVACMQRDSRIMLGFWVKICLNHLVFRATGVNVVTLWTSFVFFVRRISSVEATWSRWLTWIVIWPWRMQVASWGAYLLSRNILTMSFAPRDSHEAQVQFALERGVPAMIGVLATNRLPYPARAFDMAHCSRCLIPWHLYGNNILIAAVFLSHSMLAYCHRRAELDRS